VFDRTEVSIRVDVPELREYSIHNMAFRKTQQSRILGKAFQLLQQKQLLCKPSLPGRLHTSVIIWPRAAAAMASITTTTTSTAISPDYGQTATVAE